MIICFKQFVRLEPESSVIARLELLLNSNSKLTEASSTASVYKKSGCIEQSLRKVIQVSLWLSDFRRVISDLFFPQSYQDLFPTMHVAVQFNAVHYVCLAVLLSYIRFLKYPTRVKEVCSVAQRPL